MIIWRSIPSPKRSTGTLSQSVCCGCPLSFVVVSITLILDFLLTQARRSALGHAPSFSIVFSTARLKCGSSFFKQRQAPVKCPVRRQFQITCFIDQVQRQLP